MFDINTSLGKLLLIMCRIVAYSDSGCVYGGNAVGKKGECR